VPHRTSAIRVQIDRSKPGSVEHFWHFLLGVAFPLLDFHRREPHRLPGARLGLESCGAAMDPLLPPLARSLGFDLEIPPRNASPPSPQPAETTLRLDREPAGRSPRPAWPASIVEGSLHLPRWDLFLARGGAQDAGFVEALRKTAETVVSRTAEPDCCRTAPPDEAYLLLRRSPEPAYFKAGGNAEIPTYGTGRRSLEGLETCRDALLSRGVPALVYEPGAHTLTCQARHFSRARGAIGIRGAEFANLVWMRPASTVLMLSWESTWVPPQRALARAMGITSYIEMDIPPSDRAHLDPDRILLTLLEPGSRHHE
jgi:hypothetical protein